MDIEEILRENNLPIYRCSKNNNNYEYEVTVLINNEIISKFRCNGRNVQEGIHKHTKYRVALRKVEKNEDYDLIVERLDRTTKNRKPILYVIDKAWQSKGEGLSKGHKGKIFVDWKTGKVMKRGNQIWEEI